MSAAHFIADRRERVFEIETALIAGRLGGAGKLQVQVAQGLVRLVVGPLHFFAELTGFKVVTGKYCGAHLGQDFARAWIVPLARGARPQGGLVELEMLGMHSAKHHGPEPAIADR